jgi:hypothetical protein
MDTTSETGAPQGTGQLPSPVALLTESWEFTKRRLDLVGWYVVIALGPLLVAAVLTAAGVWAYNEGSNLFFGVVALSVLAFVAVMWAVIVASLGLFYAVAQAEDTRFAAGWQWAKAKFWSVVWIATLLMLVLTAGLLGFVIPALVIMVYTIFYFLAFIEHDYRGLHALAASTNYVYGRFWPVAGRFAFIMLFVILLQVGITLIFVSFASLAQLEVVRVGLEAAGEVVGTVISFIMTIVMMRYLVLLYSGVRAVAPAYDTANMSTSYKVYRVLAWVGALATIGFLAGGLLVLSTVAMVEGWL